MRRKPSWLAWRLALCVAGLLVSALVWNRTSNLGWSALAATPFLPIALLGRLADPDAERILQRRHRADYLLNGGEHEGEPYYLLIRDKHLMLVPRSEDDVRSALEIPRIRRILVDDEVYVPVYVSEAKDPPVQADAPLTGTAAQLQLELDDSRKLVFDYQGAFSKHLAETAAHGVYSVRERLLRPQPAEFARISG